MPRLIDADALMMRINGHGTNKFGILHDVDIREFINEQPTIDAVPVVHGEWIWDIDGMDWGIGSWKCKNCHARPNTYWQCDSTINPLMFASSSYCPNCGAKMDAKEGTEE